MLITGASSGLGATIARQCATQTQQPFAMYLTGRQTSALQQIQHEISSSLSTRVGSQPTTIHYGIGDVSRAPDVQRLYQDCKDKLGGLDILIANAGIARKGLIEDMTEEEYDLSFNTNVKGVFLWLKTVLPQMKMQKSGQIIVVSSVLGLRALSPRASLYTATKYALEGLVGGLRKDLAGSGVKVALINPGAINTPWWDSYERGGDRTPRSEDAKKAMLPVEDVGNAVMTIIQQPTMSDIERIVIEPAIRAR